jgi:superfamily II DNA or RNA helicase
VQTPQSDLQAGDIVRLRGRHWRVLRIAVFRDCSTVQLLGSSGEASAAPRTFLLPFDRPMKQCREPRPLVVSRRRWMRALGALVRHAAPWDGLQSAAGARLDLFPWQLEPCLAILHGLSHRVLIADDVGMGKTIQAGLILSELQRRGQAERVLIVTPAGLRDQWAGELHTRFGITVDVVDAEWIRHGISALPHGLNPWSVPRVRVTSLDFIKQPEVLQAAESVVWDLLLVDEAHIAAAGTGRGSAVSALGRRARRIVLLTATPHSGIDERFTDLCNIGCLDRRAARDPLLIFRRTRRAAGLAATRRIRVLRVVPTAAERRMHDLLARYTELVWREAGRRGRQEARLAMIVLRKRALSSARSLAVSIDRRLQLLETTADTAVQTALALWEDDRAAGDEEPVSSLGATGLEDTASERSWLKAIQSAAIAAARAGESKGLALCRLLRRSTEPIIVFTEYRDTLLRLARIAPVADVLQLHGALAREERQETVRRFNSGAARLLLATDAAGEGLNLQSACRWVVNYELPWNPLRLQQRIGRVDRLGQSRMVHALHLIARDTPEMGLLLRLHARIERVRRIVGGADDVVGAISEEQVAAAVMEGLNLPLQGWDERTRHPLEATGRSPRRQPPFSEDVCRPSTEMRRFALAECRRLERVRGLPISASSADVRRRDRSLLVEVERRSPWVVSIRGRAACRLIRRLITAASAPARSTSPNEPSRLLSGTICLCRVTIGTAGGSAVEDLLVSLIAPDLLPANSSSDGRSLEPIQASQESHRPPAHRLASRSSVWFQRHASVLREICRQEADRRIRVLQSRYTTAMHARSQRDALLVEHLDELAGEIWQPGLFERRAEHRVAAERAVRETARRELEGDLSQGSHHLTVVGEVEVVLVMQVEAGLEGRGSRLGFGLGLDSASDSQPAEGS